MVAAAITPTSVQVNKPTYSALTGDEMKLVTYTVVLTKVTQADWIVVATYCDGTFLSAEGYTIVAGGNGVAEPLTYTAAGTTLAMGSASVGTTTLKITCKVS